MKVPLENLRVVSLGVGVYPEPKPSLLSKMRWYKYLRSVQLLQKTLEINTQSMDSTSRAILFKQIATVRISDTFEKPEDGDGLVRARSSEVEYSSAARQRVVRQPRSCAQKTARRSERVIGHGQRQLIMAIPESQLETWSHQGSIKQSSTTYATVKRSVSKRPTLKYADKSFWKSSFRALYGNDNSISTPKAMLMWSSASTPSITSTLAP